ncbi:DUF6441 family protein [Sphingomonas sp. R86521]|uniref:DUF6441 family protein n=1 Tax=Sphingomonas sp. R86521 TaxID=3093860 RepID=UPI0036D2825E
MKIDIEVPDFAALMSDVEGGIAKAATAAMRETSKPTVMSLREQVTSNGLGQRLANTWRDRVYPEKRESITPSGYIWSNAPDVIDSFVRGATVRPVAGGKYLWIPTKNVPRARGRSRATSTKRMTPDEVQAEFNQEFVILRGRAGRLLAFLARDRGVTKRGALRKAGKGRMAHGKQELTLMFTLVRTVRLPKLLDLKKPADQWGSAFVAAFERRFAA